MSELYYVTSNSDKFELVYRYLERNAPNIQLKPCAHDLIEIQSYNQEEVAIDKARQAWKLLQKPVLIDDAGIYFEKYRDFPGVFTKFVYHALGRDGLRKLVVPGDRACFRLTMVYWYGPEQYATFIGECQGHIVDQVQFVPGLGSPYDALFAPVEDPRSFAELHATGEHEQYHYRLKALQKFLHWRTLRDEEH